MDWIPRTERLPPEGERVGVYDIMHVGMSTGVFRSGVFDVDENNGRGTFVTHWTEDTTPSGGPDPQEAHEVTKKHFQ